MAASGTTLTELFGVSDVLAAKILGHAGDVARFPSADHFASYAGVAPVEVSSGDAQRHRLNRGGNRALNAALHLVARTQLNHETPGRAHYERKLAEAKGRGEAMRSVKRQLAKVVHRRLCADRRRQAGGLGGREGATPVGRTPRRRDRPGG